MADRIPWKVGDTPSLTGYITTVKSCMGRSCRDLEEALGYRAGALRDGYFLALLDETVGVDDFEFRGYTHFEDGVPRGAGETVHDRLKNGFLRSPLEYDRRHGWPRLLERGAARINRRGAERSCKVLPLRDRSEIDYKPGGGIVQFKLTPRPKRFRIVAMVAAGEQLQRIADAQGERFVVKAEA